jgi:hypothetical protein
MMIGSLLRSRSVEQYCRCRRKSQVIQSSTSRRPSLTPTGLLMEGILTNYESRIGNAVELGDMAMLVRRDKPA